MRRYRTHAIVILAVLAALVVLQNLATTETRFLFFSVKAPLAALLGAMVLIGFVLGLLTAWRHGGAKR